MDGPALLVLAQRRAGTVLACLILVCFCYEKQGTAVINTTVIIRGISWGYPGGGGVVARISKQTRNGDPIYGLPSGR